MSAKAKQTTEHNGLLNSRLDRDRGARVRQGAQGTIRHRARAQDSRTLTRVGIFPGADRKQQGC